MTTLRAQGSSWSPISSASSMDPKGHSSRGGHSGSGGGSSSSKGSTPDVKGGKRSDILDGLHPRIETRGQSRRHEKKGGDKKKSSKQSVPNQAQQGDPAGASTQADSVTVEALATRSQVHQDLPGYQLPGGPQTTETYGPPRPSGAPQGESLTHQRPSQTERGA